MRTFLPETSKRVALHTDEKINLKIHDQTLRSLERIGNDTAKIKLRLNELDQEWDIERVIEANASTIALVGLALGATVDKRYYLLPTLVAGFLLQHALQGWCPPVPILRRLGFRTQREIDNERALLMSRRGDFDNIKEAGSDKAMKIIEA